MAVFDEYEGYDALGLAGLSARPPDDSRRSCSKRRWIG